MREKILALSLSILFLGGITITSYAQSINSTISTIVDDNDDKNKKKSSKKTKKDCNTKKSCCKHDFEKKECKDEKVKTKKKDGDKL